MIDVKVLRQDPDRVRASQRARGESESLVDDLLAADEARRNAIAAYEELRAEQKDLGKLISRAQGEERAGLLARTKELADLVKKAEAAQNEISAVFDAMLKQVGNLVVRRTCRSAARTTTWCWRPAARRGTSRPRASRRETTSSSANCSARSTSSAARRSPARASTT